jgi:hypothetical protein
MKVRTLELFLRSLRAAVTAADGGSSLPAELDAVSAGLDPFAALDFGQFAAFLRQAQHYRDSGAVSVPPADPNAQRAQTSLCEAASLAERLSDADILDAAAVAAERKRVYQDLEQALGTFLESLGIKVNFKDDQKKFQTVLKRAETRALAVQVREALAGVTDETSLSDPARQDRLRAVAERLPLADLKAIAEELGAPASGRTPEAVLSGIVAQVTGIKPAAKKKQPSPKAAVDQAVVQQQAVKLKGLVEKSFDPGGLSSAELEAAITELQPRSVGELRAIAKELDLPKVGKKKEEEIIRMIREKLQEADRARASIEV